MSTTTRTQRRYDHRLKELVRATGNCEIALECGVPRSTAYGWLTGSHADVVTLDGLPVPRIRVARYAAEPVRLGSDA